MVNIDFHDYHRGRDAWPGPGNTFGSEQAPLQCGNCRWYGRIDGCRFSGKCWTERTHSGDHVHWWVATTSGVRKE